MNSLERYHWLRANNLCGRCGGEPVPGKSECESCRDKGRAKAKEWYRKNILVQRERGKFKQRRSRLAKYGLTPEEHQQLFDNQQGRCAICGDDLKEGYRQAIDHCHTTGRVRGLLCHHCNIGLGQFRDSKERLLAAIAYLEG